MSSTHTKLFVEGNKGRGEGGELLILGLRDRKYVDFNLYDFLEGKVSVNQKNLADLNLGPEDSYKIYLHNGNDFINAEGSQTSEKGYYAWYHPDNEFKIIVQFSSSGFLITDYTLTDSVLTETTLG